MAFEVGDKVVFPFDKDGVIGEVVAVKEDSKYPYRVVWESKYDWDWFEESDLVPAEPNKE